MFNIILCSDVICISMLLEVIERWRVIFNILLEREFKFYFVMFLV